LLRTQSEIQNTLYHISRGNDFSFSWQIWEECTTLPSAMQLQILETLGKLKLLLSSEAVVDSPTGKNATQEYRLHVLVKGSSTLLPDRLWLGYLGDTNFIRQTSGATRTS
jgi:hypothetical protein